MSKRPQESTAKEGSAVAKPRPMSLVSKNRPRVRGKTLLSIRVLQTARRIKSWIRVLFREAQRNRCVTAAKTQQRIQNSGNKMTIRFEAQGNLCGVVSVKVQEAQGNWCEVRTSKSEGQRWNSTTCRCRYHAEIDIGPSSRDPECHNHWSDRSTRWESLQEFSTEVGSLRRRASTWHADQCIDLGIIYVDKDESLSSSRTILQWKFGRIGTPISWISRICSISLRDWSWNMKLRFWMHPRLIGQLPHGRDLLWRTTR